MHIKAAVVATINLFASAAFGQQAEPSLDRVFSFTHTERAQHFQEIATTIRSIGGIRKLSVDAEEKTLSLSGTADQIALSEWLFRQLDRPAGDRTAAEYKMSGAGDENAVRVFYVTHDGTLQDLQELSSVLRLMAKCYKVFAYAGLRAITLRGTTDQMALAEWVFNDLDKATQASAGHEHRVPGSDNEVVRLFYLAHAGTPQRLLEIAAQVQSATNIHVFSYSTPRVLALRGTADQIATVERYVQEFDRP